MYAIWLTIVFLVSLCISITCQAATFEKVSSSFSVERDVHLNCPRANYPADRDWPFSQTVENDAEGYSSWGHTPILKKDSAFLVSLHNNETASADMSCGDPGGGEGTVPMDAGSEICHRVRVSVHQGPILEVWQPGFGSRYTVDTTVATSAEAYYKINALSGERIGDEVTLLVEGWTEHHENSNGPDGSAIVQYIGPAGVTGFSNIAYTPAYKNLSDGPDGEWHPVSGLRYVTARIGDTIGMRSSAYSAMNQIDGPMPSWPISYMPCGLYALSSISLDIVPKPLTGDMDGNNNINIGDAILALQVASGQKPDLVRYDFVYAEVDVNGDNKIGLEEVIYIVQTVAGLRE